MDRRIVLAPQGLPTAPEARERCLELLLRCGADLSRVIDDSKKSLGAFADYVASIGGILAQRERVMIVLTRVSPAAGVVVLRDALVSRVPVLERAPWILYADPLVEPNCLDGLRALGSLRGAIWDAPVWIDEDGGRYLVLSPHIRRPAEYGLRERLAADDHDVVPQRSTFRSLRRVSSTGHPTVRIPAIIDDRPTIRVPPHAKKIA
jgi:hypothetical protein